MQNDAILDILLRKIRLAYACAGRVISDLSKMSFMRWYIFLAFLIIAPSLKAQHPNLPEESRSQVREYISQITANENVGINFWALSEVYKDNPETASYIRSYIKREENANPLLETLSDTTLSHTQKLRQSGLRSQSPFLLIAYLLSEENNHARHQAVQEFENIIDYPENTGIDYPALMKTLLENQPITDGILPSDTFNPIHFLLFFDRETIRSGLLSDRYLKNAASKWSFHKSKSLSQIMGLTALYRIFYVRDEYDQALDLYRPLIDDKLFPNSIKKLNILRALDYTMYRLGYYNRSLDIIRERSLPLADYLNQKEVEIKMRIAQGSYLYYIGKITQSKKTYNNAQNQAEAQNIPYSKGYVYNNQAVNYWKSGEFDQYLDLEFQALEEAQNENNYNLHFDILKNLFTYYRTKEDFDTAKRYLSKARKLAQKQKDKESLARLSYLEGLLYRDSNASYNRAIASFDKALSFIDKENYYTSYQDILTAKGKIMEKQGDYKHVLAVYNQMLQMARERQDQRNMLFASFSKANTYLALGKEDSAKTILDTLQTKNLDALDFYQLVKARTVQARYHDKSGTPEQGIDVLQPVITQIVQRSRSSGDLETGFWQVEPEYLNAFETYANLLIKNNEQEQAVEVLDQLKTINDAALYQNPLVRSKVLNEEELSRYKRLTADLDALRKQLLTANTNQQVDLQQQIDEKSAEKNALDRKITANANPDPVSVNYLQRRMDARQRVLHITELNDIYYLAVISRTEVSFTKIPITRNIRDLFEHTIHETAAGNTDLSALYSITKLLGITSLPDHVQKLTIIPDSYLYQLPMDILPMTQPENSKSYGDVTYLIERYQTNFMTSLNDFRNPDSHRQHTVSYAGFGVSEFGNDRENLVPLPKAKTEIKDISNQLQALSNKKSFINDQATEEAFRKAAPGARLVHLATHSEVSGRDPMFSSIYFSRGPNTSESKFSGRIFAYELFELNLNNELIMLNSCESGSGSYLQGTGVVGLSRALRYAGAQSLILNLWSVNDMLASEFAVQFYKEINDGDSKSEALRKAKLHFLKTKNANPHYWGSYMLLGNETAIVHPHQFTKHVAAASFMIFFFLLVMASSIVEFLKRRKTVT